jgi:hypothetical protein
VTASFDPIVVIFNPQGTGDGPVGFQKSARACDL